MKNDFFRGQKYVFGFSLRPRAKSFTAAFFWLFFFPAFLPAQEWYKSNQAGMALERSPSRMAALHNEWALLVERTSRTALPALLRPYDNPSYTLEQRLLYEQGKLKRRQWIFRSGGMVRVNASLPADIASTGKAKSGEIPPFIEVFASNRTLTETHQYLPAGVYTTRYSYREGLLVKAETFLDKAPLWTDSYRYTRQALPRGVERIYHEAGSHAAPFQGTGSKPPAAPVNLDIRETPSVPGFVSPGSPYDSSIMTEVLGSIYAVNAARVIYDTDAQGKVLTETRYDEENQILAVITNEWSGDRIAEIRWSAPPDQGRIVFHYSGKNRVSEEDYRNGVLERTVKARGDEEIEEIYMRGKVILRAVWKDGRKISEEQLR